METIRFGKISSVNYEAGTVRVVYHEKDDCVTSEIPLLSFEYMMPEVDDAVLVLHLSNGAEVGVVLGRPWSDENKPPEGSQGLWRKDLDREAGKGMLRYKDGTLTIKMNKVVLEAKELTVKAETTITENTTMKKGANVGQTLTATTDCIGGGKASRTIPTQAPHLAARPLPQTNPEVIFCSSELLEERSSSRSATGPFLPSRTPPGKVPGAGRPMKGSTANRLPNFWAQASKKGRWKFTSPPPSGYDPKRFSPCWLAWPKPARFSIW